MKRRWVRMAWIVWALGLIPEACVAADDNGPAVGGERPPQWVKTEFYFGANLPDGQSISPQAWTDFMDQILTPHFPKGLTVHQAYGQMQHSDGRIERQTSWVVVVLHPVDPAINQAIEEVIASFRTRFDQAQAVQISLPLLSARFYAD